MLRPSVGSWLLRLTRITRKDLECTFEWMMSRQLQFMERRKNAGTLDNFWLPDFRYCHDWHALRVVIIVHCGWYQCRKAVIEAWSDYASVPRDLVLVGVSLIKGRQTSTQTRTKSGSGSGLGWGLPSLRPLLNKGGQPQPDHRRGAEEGPKGRQTPTRTRTRLVLVLVWVGSPPSLIEAEGKADPNQNQKVHVCFQYGIVEGQSCRRL